MRIKRKKHLKERLESVKDYLVVCERDITNILEAVKDKKIIDYYSAFNNLNPVSLEIGCGKGGFVTEMAKLNPDKNYLAVEMLENIIVMAAENSKKSNLKNVKFINTGAEYLPRYILDNSIREIYLNFSPPYPPKTYENRRLTNARFLNEYSKMLVDGAVLYQKTDDLPFFEYSVEKLKENGFLVEILSEESDCDFVKVRTEYENKFIEKGMPIYRLKATKM